MPGNKHVLPPLRGDDAYDRFLDRLLRLEQKAGSTIRTRSELVEAGIDALAKRHGIEAPRRAAPRGTNRYGEPRRT